MEDGPAKPDPFPVVKAAELLGVDPANTALVCRAAAFIVTNNGTVVQSRE